MYELVGTWEEIRARDAELTGRKVRLTVLSPETDGSDLSPAERFAAAMQEAEDLERDLPFTPGGDETQRLLREARAGAMYGYEPCE